MSNTVEKTEKRRLRSSYLTAVISIALVLLMVGIVALLILNARKMSIYVKENLGLTVVLNDTIAEPEILNLQRNLDASAFVKTSQYITREMAAKEMQEELGADFVNFLGYNPLLPIIEIKLKADYASPDSLRLLERKLKLIPGVLDVRYEQSMVETFNDNIKKISAFILSIGAIFFIIAWVLMNNTIRLAVYSRRFNINTMQLVGATRGFIRRPFIFRGILQGIWGAFIAIALLLGILYFGEQEMPELELLIDPMIILQVFAGMLVLGIIIHVISSFFAVTKYLKMKEDDLYTS
jgi:cell division transport system permease protein